MICEYRPAIASAYLIDSLDLYRSPVVFAVLHRSPVNALSCSKFFESSSAVKVLQLRKFFNSENSPKASLVQPPAIVNAQHVNFDELRI